MKKEITNVSVYFQGTKKGKRKIEFQSERIAQLDGHLMLTPEQFNEYERHVWNHIDSMGYKNFNKGQIKINHGHEEDGMSFIQLLPKQSQLILRRVV
jgi:hypothetical protein